MQHGSVEESDLQVWGKKVMAENAIAVQEKPILFSGAMVRAVIEGRKTQTRRVVKPQPTVFPEQGKGLWHHVKGAKWESGLPYRCPYGKPGDRLWVRHSFWLYESTGANPGNRHIWDEFTKAARWQTGEQTLDVTPDTKPYIRKPSIHMPRWASRLTLEIVSVKVERVQEISGTDVLAEGIDNGKSNPSMGQRWENMQHMAFQELWDSINEKRGFGWDKNPFVWAIEFKRVK